MLSYRHPRTGEWAHDVRDPLAQARCSFVEPAAAARPPRAGEALRLLEIGFGRGLNTATALAWLRQAGREGPVRALGYEPWPERLAPWPACPEELRPWAPWWGEIPGRWQPQAGISVEVRSERAADGLQARPERHDWIFLDLYSPGRHPEDWEPALFAALAAAAAPGAALTSYCTARSLRDGLSASGWQVRKLQTPGRRDSLLALFPL